jgi:hypothetical protein
LLAAPGFSQGREGFAAAILLAAAVPIVVLIDPSAPARRH